MDPAASSLRERNKRDKLHRIRMAARELFLAQGFEATTTRQVAERAGVASGTVFLYAADKQELLFLIFSEEIGGVIGEAFTGLEEPQGRAPALARQVGQVFGCFFAHYHKSPELSRLFVKEMAFLRGAKQAAYAQLTVGFLGQIAELVVAAQRRGEVSPKAEPLRVASNFFALYLFHLFLWLNQGAPAPADAVAQLVESLQMQIDGVHA